MPSVCTPAMGESRRTRYLFDTNTLHTNTSSSLSEKHFHSDHKQQGVKHSLVSSAYNDRRKECEKGLNMLQKMIDINSLGDLNNEQFERYKILVSDEILQKE